MNLIKSRVKKLQLGIGLATVLSSCSTDTPKLPNILLITADDLSCESVGAFGCKVKNTTPNIDKFALQGMKFGRAHVNIAVSNPCRAVLLTGKYSHNSSVEGFYKATKHVKLLPEYLKEKGYMSGLLGKTHHSTPRKDFTWDYIKEREELGMGRDSEKYYEYVKDFLQKSKKSESPFYLNVNSHDPHRPFSGSDQEKRWLKGKTVKLPSKTFTANEVVIPGFLPELPEVRKEIAEYYSSVRRLDDVVGVVLKALKESDLDENTIVIFMSDHGMALPFAKTNCYFHSTRTPFIIRWPGVTKPASVDKEHFISTIDFLPTILEVAGIKIPEDIDGRSIVSVLKGQKDDNRMNVFTQFHETSGRRRYPMRCIQNKKYGYIFNPWSDGEKVFRNESQSGRTFKAMRRAADSSEYIKQRVKLFVHRTQEEFYDFEKDPNALNNLINDPEYRDKINKMREELKIWMTETGDPALEAFENLNDSLKIKEWTDKQQHEAFARKRQKH